MKTAVLILLIAVCLFSTVLAYCCCKVAKDEDERHDQ